MVGVDEGGDRQCIVGYPTKPGGVEECEVTP
jgi:hypothetical protein